MERRTDLLSRRPAEQCQGSIKRIGVAALALCSLILFGCGPPILPTGEGTPLASRTWQYSPSQSAQADRQPIKRSLTVLPFDDARRQPEGGDTDHLAYCLIPLVLWCDAEYSNPEQVSDHFFHSSRWRFDPPIDISKALMEELKLSQLFEQVSYKASNGGSDLVLAGTLQSTKYTQTWTYYGLSLAGPLLHVVGLPMDSIRNDLVFDLELIDRSTKDVLWQKRYSASHEMMFWFYTFRFRTDFYYDMLLRQMMPAIISDVATALQQNR